VSRLLDEARAYRLLRDIEQKMAATRVALPLSRWLGLPMTVLASVAGLVGLIAGLGTARGDLIEIVTTL